MDLYRGVVSENEVFCQSVARTVGNFPFPTFPRPSSLAILSWSTVQRCLFLMGDSLTTDAIKSNLLIYFGWWDMSTISWHRRSQWILFIMSTFWSPFSLLFPPIRNLLISPLVPPIENPTLAMHELPYPDRWESFVIDLWPRLLWPIPLHTKLTFARHCIREGREMIQFSSECINCKVFTMCINVFICLFINSWLQQVCKEEVNRILLLLIPFSIVIGVQQKSFTFPFPFPFSFLFFPFIHQHKVTTATSILSSLSILTFVPIDLFLHRLILSGQIVLYSFHSPIHEYCHNVKSFHLDLQKI